jgi:aspartyl/asparaginyl beta-hydroxylase (cupin superfamily)
MWVRQPEHKGDFRPAIINETNWPDLYARTDRVVSELMTRFPGCDDRARVVSVVCPGDYVPPHTDMHPPEWITRVHVPIITNDGAFFISQDQPHHMEVGSAYIVNTEVPHAIRNDGTANRVHLMFDVIQ